MQTEIIGLGHRARQGKDTVASLIIEEFGDRYDVRRYAIADALKGEVLGREEELAAKYGIELNPNPDRNDPLCPGPYGKQSRILQAHGQARREEDAFYWVHRLAEAIAVEQPQFAIISDLRYLNESYWVRSQGGIYVKVERPGFISPDRDPNHASEVELEHVAPDYHIKAENLNILRREALEFFTKVLSFLNNYGEEVVLDAA